MTNDFTAHYDLYHAPILRYCLWKCHDKDIGQDLMQETFMRYYLCLLRDEKILNARAFLYRIAHNLFISHVRKKKETSLDQLLESGFEPSADPWPKTLLALDLEHTLKNLRRMPDPYRQVLTRRFVQGLAPRDIAGLTGETANTVSVRVFRGLKILRALVESAPNRN